MDYKERCLKLFRATERAVDILIAAQREYEEMYISAPELIRLAPDAPGQDDG